MTAHSEEYVKKIEVYDMDHAIMFYFNNGSKYSGSFENLSKDEVAEKLEHLARLIRED